MANIKSEKKRILVRKRNKAQNVPIKSRMRHSIKDCELAISSNDLAKAKELIKIAFHNIDKCVKHGAEHKNTAARQKSHLMTKLNALENSKKK